MDRKLMKQIMAYPCKGMLGSHYNYAIDQQLPAKLAMLHCMKKAI